MARSELVGAMGLALGANAPERWGGRPPMATCPGCGEPLVSTMLWAGAEFVCVECGRHVGFVQPRPERETPELRARYEALLAEWEARPRKDLRGSEAWLAERLGVDGG